MSVERRTQLIFISKHWNMPSVWEMLQPLLFWKFQPLQEDKQHRMTRRMSQELIEGSENAVISLMTNPAFTPVLWLIMQAFSDIESRHTHGHGSHCACTQYRSCVPRTWWEMIGEEANQSHDRYFYVQFYIFQQFPSKARHAHFLQESSHTSKALEKQQEKENFCACCEAYNFN
jgi:hypothetical protein